MESIDKGTILIVDDNPTNIKVLFDVLDASGFKISTAKSGESAIKRLERNIPDLILLDVMMPGIDGFETCRRLKASELTKSIPIIFMTALADTEHKVKGLQMGAVDYITKPIQHEEALARINVHLELRDLTKNLEQRVAKRTSELTQAIAELQQAQLQIVQSEKMSALGQLVAGVAHEINNPLGCINGNLNHVEEYFKDLSYLIELYQQNYPNPVAEIVEQSDEMELEFLQEDLPKLINSMQDATRRIQKISTSLRTFSRADTENKVAFDIREGIDSTLMILKHRLKASDKHPEIEIIKQYGDIPAVECFPGQLNQVFMNLISNAIDALEEAIENNKITTNPAISICIQINKNQVLISIKDNGMGMPEEVKARIFDHLYTTKAVGKGTGLGLSIARQIIVEKHQGGLTCFSEIGKGTEFAIAIPI